MCWKNGTLLDRYDATSGNLEKKTSILFASEMETHSQ